MENNNKQKGQRKCERKMFEFSFSNAILLYSIQMVHKICFLYVHNHNTKLNEIRTKKVHIYNYSLLQFKYSSNPTMGPKSELTFPFFYSIFSLPVPFTWVLFFVSNPNQDSFKQKCVKLQIGIYKYFLVQVQN